MKEGISITMWAVYGVIALCVVALLAYAILGIGGGLLMKPVLNTQRQAIQASNEYVQSKQAELSNLAQTYRRLEVQVKDADPGTALAIQGQQRAIRDEMRRAVDLIPEDAVTSEVRSIIGGR